MRAKILDPPNVTLVQFLRTPAVPPEQRVSTLATKEITSVAVRTSRCACGLLFQDRLRGVLRAEKRRERISTLRSAPKTGLCEGLMGMPQGGKLTQLEPEEETKGRRPLEDREYGRKKAQESALGGWERSAVMKYQRGR